MAREPANRTIAFGDVFQPEQEGQFKPLGSVENLEYDDVTALNNVLAELGQNEEGGGFVTAFREMVDVNGKKTPDEYLERFNATEFTLDALKARWGAGKYKITVYQDGRILTRKVITIAKDPLSAVPVAAPVQQAVDLMPIIQAMQDGFKQMFTAMQSNQPKTQSRSEMLREMAIMREMFAPAPTAAQPNAIELMRLGMEMANSGTGGGEGNNAWVSKMLDTFAPALVPALTSAMTPREPARVAVSALPAPTSRPDALPPTQTENPVSIIITQYLNMLKSAASKNAPTDEYADSILNSIPASNIVELEAMLKPADWRERLKPHTDAVEQYPQWFTALRDALLQYIEEDKEPLPEEVNTHLTGVGGAGSVFSHENADSTNFDKPEGDVASIT